MGLLLARLQPGAGDGAVEIEAWPGVTVELLAHTGGATYEITRDPVAVVPENWGR